MTTLNRTSDTTASVVPTYARHPQRISITVNWNIHQYLLERSGSEGRSLSNLVAHLLELASTQARTTQIVYGSSEQAGRRGH